MEPIVIEPAELPSVSIPSHVLIETSFLCDLIWADRGSQEDRAARPLEMIQLMRRTGTTRLWVTPAIVQEAGFVFMKARMRSEAQARVGRALTWAAFKKQHPAEFSAAYPICAKTIPQIRRLLAVNGIEEALPRVRGDVRTTGRWIAGYMSWYLRHYPIEPADALHLACARVDGTRAVTTNDLDLQKVEGFSFFTCRRSQ